MSRGPLLGFLVTELSTTLALPLGYAVAGGGCAPPGILCYARDTLCPAVCTDAWAQFPTVAAYGAAVGAVPAFLMAFLALGIERRRGRRWTVLRPVAMPALGIVGLVATLLLVVAIFPYMGGYVVALVAGFGVVLTIAFGEASALAERTVFRPSPPRGG